MIGELPGGPVTAVLFDYGNTLITVRRPHEALARAYADIEALLRDRNGGGIPTAEVLRRAVHDRLELAVADHDRTGVLEEIDLVSAARNAYAALGVEVTGADLDEILLIEQRAWWEGITVPPDVPAVLARLRERGLRTGICSNAPYHPLALVAQLDHLGLAALLDSAVFSSQVGWRKPSPRIFEAALDRLGAAAAATVMVGDTVRTDVAGAHRAGMRAVRLREHVDDSDGSEPADAVIDRLVDLPAVLPRGESPS